jgi:twinkle protein
MNWNELGIDISKLNRSGKTKCPKCSASRKKPNELCLSIDIEKGMYNCFHCGWSGIAELSRDEELKRAGSKKHSLPNPSSSPLSEETIEYFVSRGISKETLDRAGVTESISFMPQVNKEVKTINFNYFRNGELVNIKYRDFNKNFKMYKDAEVILYNLDSIKDTDEAVITEGEIDCLSFIETGVYNVVSVPTGANKNLDYLKNCRKYFENKKRIVICVDNDEKGELLKTELIRRFGKDKCRIIDLHGHKDANEVLMKLGIEYLGTWYDFPKGLPLDDVQYLDNVADLMMKQYEHGREIGTTTHLEILDDHFKWKKGQVTLFHGIGNFGKTTFVMFLCLLKSMHDGDKWGVFSPENYPANEFYDMLIHMYLGKNTGKDYSERCTIKEYEDAMKFIGKHFFYIYPENSSPAQENINNKFEELIMSEGITGGVIDPFNQLDNEIAKYGRDDLYISKFLTEEKRFAQKHDFYKVIVAHPKQLKKNESGGYDIPTYYDLCGGSMWSNKCDNIIAIHAPHWGTNRADPQRIISVQKVKTQDQVGIPGDVRVLFERKSFRFS